MLIIINFRKTFLYHRILPNNYNHNNFYNSYYDFYDRKKRMGLKAKGRGSVVKKKNLDMQQEPFQDVLQNRCS